MSPSINLKRHASFNSHILQGGVWTRERWWYKLAQVCLGLSLVCSRGTPVAEILEHSPPLPLIINHVEDSDFVTTEDEEGIILALKHCDRVRRIRLDIPVPNLQKVIMEL